MGNVSGFVDRVGAQIDHDGSRIDLTDGLVWLNRLIAPSPPFEFVGNEEHDDDGERGEKPRMGMGKKCETGHRGG